MKLLITRPMILTGDGGTRTFYAGLTVDVDAATVEKILAQQAGIAVEPAPSATTEIPVTLRRRKSQDD